MLTNIIMAVLLFNLGFFARWIFFKNKPIGTIRVDQSDTTEKPYLFLELSNYGMNEILTRDQVTFKVKRENYIKENN